MRASGAVVAQIQAEAASRPRPRGGIDTIHGANVHGATLFLNSLARPPIRYAHGARRRVRFGKRYPGRRAHWIFHRAGAWRQPALVGCARRLARTPTHVGARSGDDHRPPAEDQRGHRWLDRAGSGRVRLATGFCRGRDDETLSATRRRGRARTAPALAADRQLLEYFVPFEAAVEAGVSTAMESYGEINGEPLAASGRLLKGLLRQRLGFGGMLVTDWAEIENLHSFHRVAASAEDAVLLAMGETSIDMSMVPTDTSFPRILQALVRAGKVDEARLDTSVRRVLELKAWLGILPPPAHAPPGSAATVTGPEALNTALGASVGDAAGRQLSLDAARAAVTLLLNRPPPDRPTAANSTAPYTADQCSTYLNEGHWGSDGGRADGPPTSRVRVRPGRAAWLPRMISASTAAASEPVTPSEPPPPLLPLNLSAGTRLLLVGPLAASLRMLVGGWSVHWQGAHRRRAGVHGRLHLVRPALARAPVGHHRAPHRLRVQRERKRRRARLEEEPCPPPPISRRSSSGRIGRRDRRVPRTAVDGEAGDITDLSSTRADARCAAARATLVPPPVLLSPRLPPQPRCRPCTNGEGSRTR